MTRNPDKNNDTSVVVNEDKLKIISTQIEKKVNDIEQKLYLINSLFSDIEYCWSDSAADLLRENYHYDKETAENIIYNLKQRKKEHRKSRFAAKCNFRMIGWYYEQRN